MRSTFVMFSFFFLVTLASSFSLGASTLIGNLNHHEIPIPIPQPESIAFDCNGSPYVGVADGRIFKWLGLRLGWTEFATTSPYRTRALCDGSTNKDIEPICGRPLGLKFSPKTCELYIADAYFGLLRIGVNGGLARQVATSAEGDPFRFLNALDISPITGMVYFTDTSTIYQRRNWELAVSSGDKTGRLMQYNPDTNTVDVLERGLSFANGVALGKYGYFVLVAQTTEKNVLRRWLQGPRAGDLEVFATLQGAPDNICRNANGDFWIAENNAGKGKAVKFNAEGKFMKVLEGLRPVSHVEERHGNLWIGSVVNNFVGVVMNFF